jgi:hypothetical protein
MGTGVGGCRRGAVDAAGDWDGHADEAEVCESDLKSHSKGMLTCLGCAKHTWHQTDMQQDSLLVSNDGGSCDLELNYFLLGSQFI